LKRGVNVPSLSIAHRDVVTGR